MGLTPYEVTACIPTRGDVDLEPVIDSLLGYATVIVWDNSVAPDWKCAARYWASLSAPTRWIYWQDDDVIVPRSTQHALLDAAGRHDVIANWAHGDDPAGYADIPLVGAGAVADRRAAWEAIARYGAHFPLDDDFKYEADFVVGALYRDWCHAHLPFEIRGVAYNGRRLADEPWQRGLKRELADRARGLRGKT